MTAGVQPGSDLNIEYFEKVISLRQGYGLAGE